MPALRCNVLELFTFAWFLGAVAFVCVVIVQ